MYINTEKFNNINFLVLIVTNRLISLDEALCAILIFGELNQIIYTTWDDLNLAGFGSYSQ